MQTRPLPQVLKLLFSCSVYNKNKHYGSREVQKCHAVEKLYMFMTPVHNKQGTIRFLHPLVQGCAESFRYKLFFLIFLYFLFFSPSSLFLVFSLGPRVLLLVLCSSCLCILPPCSFFLLLVFFLYPTAFVLLPESSCFSFFTFPLPYSSFFFFITSAFLLVHPLPFII